MVSCCVIGAGVVGLATSRALARAGHEVIVLERNKVIGSVTSGRNSQVVHAGIYYPKGSLKARACVQGRRQLYKFCEDYKVPVLKRGKLVVATDPGQVPILQEIMHKSVANDLVTEDDRLIRLTGKEAMSMESELYCVEALLSPSTGVINGHEYMLALQGDAEDHGAQYSFQSHVEKIERNELGGVHVQINGDKFQFDKVINCAGLDALSLVSKEVTDIPRPRYAKGNYFKLENCKTPFQSLIYPIPEAAGLGVHVTIDIHGQARFGPDVEWLEDITHSDEIDYNVDPTRCESFYDEIRKYWPNLPDDSLRPDYSGVRPKIDSDGFQDFMVIGGKAREDDPQLENIVHVVGIESPGLTSSLALADHIVHHV